MSTATPTGPGAQPTASRSATAPGSAAGDGRAGSALAVEQNGINVIDESERKGAPRDMFWPWAAANISVFGIGYGSFLLSTGANFWQALIAGVLGVVLSFVLVGFVALAGTRGSAPTMVLSRAAFGVRGNGLPSLVSWILLVGWETVLVSLATLATATVFGALGWSDGDATKIVAFLVVIVIIIGAGVLGFDAIMRLQTILTIALAVMTVGYILLTVEDIDWGVVSSLPAAGTAAVVGAFILAFTGFGIGWVNAGADYSRYLPRSASRGGVVGWTIVGASISPVVLVLYGLLLAGSDPALNEAIYNDPIGALTTLLPTWYLVPFAGVAIGGLIGGAVLDVYSSGLTLLTLGLRIPRWSAALLDGVLMAIGTIYVVWIADNFFFPFQGFLITLGVPIAAWAGIFLADLASRTQAYAEGDLYRPTGRYGSVNPVAIATMVVATIVGWGLVVNTYSSAFSWEGYLVGPFGLGEKDGAWAFANIGVPVAVAIGFLGQYLLGRTRVRAQEQVLAGR